MIGTRAGSTPRPPCTRSPTGTGSRRPVAFLYSKQSAPLSRDVPADLRQGAGRPERVLLLDRQHPVGPLGHQGLLVQRQRDVEQGVLATTPQPAAAIASFVTSQRALYDAIHCVETACAASPTPTRAATRPPSRSATGSWPTGCIRRSGTTTSWPGRSTRLAARTPRRSHFQLAQHDPADAMCPARLHGALLRARPAGPGRWRAAAGASSSTWVRPAPATTRTTQPPAPTGRSTGSCTRSSRLRELGIPLGTVNWWDNQLDDLAAEHPADEPATTSPAPVWPGRTGRLRPPARRHPPAAWAANPKAGWKTTGTPAILDGAQDGERAIARPPALDHSRPARPSAVACVVALSGTRSAPAGCDETRCLPGRPAWLAPARPAPRREEARYG